MASGQAPVPTMNKGISQAGVTFIGVIVAVCVLSGTAVALRVSGRMKEFHRLHKDDWTIILAWLTCLTTVSITTYWVAEAGVGWSIIELPPAQLLKFFKIFYDLQLLYVFSVFVVKVSILFLYLRVFDTPKFRITAYVTIALCVAWFIASTTVAIIQCLPIHAAWEVQLQPTSQCMDKQKLYWGVGISNLLLDVLILCLPMPVIWTLQLNKQRKLAITFIFLTGSIVCLSSILRVTSIGIIKGSDFTKTITAAALWSSVEANVAVIAACLPTLGHVFLRFRRKMTSHATPVYDAERSGLTRDATNPNSSRKVFDPYSTNVDSDRYEMGTKMSGWKSGTNEAYVEMKTPDSPFDDDGSDNLTPATPYESRNVFITTQVKNLETVNK